MINGMNMYTHYYVYMVCYRTILSGNIMSISCSYQSRKRKFEECHLTSKRERKRSEKACPQSP